jgi:hypothetical protein
MVSSHRLTQPCYWVRSLLDELNLIRDGAGKREGPITHDATP